MLQIKKLNLTHKKDLRVILDDFNLVLNDGDKAVIIGEEGNGKSTLMKWIYDPSLIENYIEADGERVMGNERLGYLPQEMPDEDKKKTVYEYFSEEEIFWEKTPKELSVIAGKFGIKNDFFYSSQMMGSLSGGEKVKVQLMRLFIRDVSVLLLDEPSNDIDIATLTLLEKTINEWKHIVLFISHDETLIERTANMVIHIEQIKRKTEARYTVAKLPYRNYVEERLHKFELQEQRALCDRREKKIRDEKYQRVSQSVQSALANCSRQAPSVAKNLKDKMHTVKAMGRRFEREDENTGKACRFTHARIDLLGGEAGVFRAEGNVLIHRLLKELVLGILKDEADLKAHVACGGLAAVDVLPVEEHGAGRGREQAVEVLDERALAGARVADDAHELPGGDGEINIVDGDFFKRRSGAVDVPEMIRPDDWRHNFVSFIYR